MILELSVRNMTLIDHLELSLTHGLTVLTGETGAGKSILLDALLLIVGGRASVDLIRESEEELEIVAQFGLCESIHTQTNGLLVSMGFTPLEDSVLILRRIVNRQGRHRQWVNGELVTVSQLREIAEPLIDFTGQHAQQVLLKPKGQMAMLDAYADRDDLLLKMKTLFCQLQEYLLEEEQLHRSERDRQQKLDFLQFQIDEIERFALRPGEIEQLAKERERLLYTAKRKEESERALHALCDSTRHPDPVSIIQTALQFIARAKQHDASLESLVQTLSEAETLLEDSIASLRRYASKIECDPSMLEQVEERLFALRQLMRKHGDSEEAIRQAYQTMQQEMVKLNNTETLLKELRHKVEKTKQDTLQIAMQLSLNRQEAAKHVSELVQAEIADLGLDKARFEVRVRFDETNLTQTGGDQVHLLFGANPGEPMHALEKVASGGELSRVLLALKRVLLTKDLTLVSVFDEVDAGVGGAIAEAIGEKLRVIAQGRQVLCVTHLPQVASLANSHLKVEKEWVKDRTISKVRLLKPAERVQEIARMLGGKVVTETTKSHAKEYLEHAQRKIHELAAA